MHPRLKALYANPAFWRGCAEARDDNITVASYIRIIEKLETGAEVTEIPEFGQWLARRTTTVNTNTSPQ